MKLEIRDIKIFFLDGRNFLVRFNLVELIGCLVSSGFIFDFLIFPIIAPVREPNMKKVNTMGKNSFMKKIVVLVLVPK